MKRAPLTVKCDYCGRDAQLVTGVEVYPHLSWLHDKKLWKCDPCDAWVGCHENSKRHAPLGRLANASLRKAKEQAHAAFDPLWRAKMRRDGCGKGKARAAAYQWLAEQLGLPPETTHIGMFDEALCQRVVEICQPYTQRRAA